MLIIAAKDYSRQLHPSEYSIDSPRHTQVLMNTLSLHIRLHPIYSEFSPNATLFEPSERRTIVEYHVVVDPYRTGV